jgi:membrane peptidoglycan carboxypeptidase
LSDRGFITGINPMQLWLGAYLQANPKASRRAILEVSKPIRIDSYSWLFHPRLKHAQDTRIRIILEEEAFAHIQKRWARLGYPFKQLVPSYATAIGSSADRPGALAELVGIILNDGKKLPTLRFEKLEFGHDTPFQTEIVHSTVAPPPLLDPAITKALKGIMTEVVDNGTAKRVHGVYKNAKGEPLLVGGKTGTGDQRYDEFASGGRLISSRVVNRTGTFAFVLGDHFFGTVTAYVAGEDAADYKFTSALSAQMLKSLAPILQPLITAAEGQPAASLADPSPSE